MSPRIPEEPLPPVTFPIGAEATESDWRVPAAPGASDEPAKLETLRLAVRGVTHDLNNLLTGIFWHLDVALGIDPSNVEGREHVEIARTALESARSLTQELMAVVRPTEATRRTYSVAKLLVESARFVLEGSNVVARRRFAESLWACAGDPSRVRRVVDNLLLNARQAMPTGGKLTISAANVLVEPEAREGVVPGRYVEVRITDDGPGIPESVRKRLFTPQASTKTGASGIGLATCRELMQEEGGHIGVDSRIGQGTTFVLLFRTSPDTIPVGRRSAVARTTRTERVLIVDDEPQLRRLFKHALEQHGYEVDAASDGGEAVTAFDLCRSRFGESPVVVLDLTLDGDMSGIEILRALRERDPAARIIASTGLGTPAEELLGQGFSSVLRKPYALSELFGAILTLRASE